MPRWTRRRFIHTAVLSGLGALAAACGVQRAQTVIAPPTSSPTPIGRPPLTNEDRPAVKPNWNIRYFQPYTPVDPEGWRLTVEGLVEAPGSFSLADLLALPRLEQNTRI